MKFGHRNAIKIESAKTISNSTAKCMMLFHIAIKTHNYVAE